jgi:hypothetical protein
VCPTRLSKNLILDLRQVQVLHIPIGRLKIHFARFYTFSTVSTVCVTRAGAGVDSAWEQEKLEARKMSANRADSHLSVAPKKMGAIILGERNRRA